MKLLWKRRERAKAAEFMRSQGVLSPSLTLQWDAHPYVAIWSVESISHPGSIGWWVISGDLPTDGVSSSNISSAREAAQKVCKRWLETADLMKKGEPHPSVRIGDPSSWGELEPLLRSRATLILDWVQNDSVW